ncbi:MAG: PAS domain S-box protein, partial [Candidatus Hermodarchaeota archaeon]
MTLQINEYLEELIDAIPDLVVIFNSKGEVINVSQKVLEFYEIKDKDYFIGKYIYDFVVSEQLNELKENFEELKSKGYSKTKEYKLLKADGSYFHGELNSKVLNGKMNGEKLFITIVRDITSQKVLLRELNNSKQMFQLVLDNIPQHIFWKDMDSKYLGCNRNFARVAGVGEPENIIGKTDFELAWKIEEAESYYDIERLVMESETPEYHVIEPQSQANGKKAWLDVNRIPLHNSQGDVIGLLGTYEDITERKIAEEKLKESEEKFRNFADQSLLGINIVQDNKIRYVNRAYVDIFGYSIDEVKDWGLEEISQTIHPDDREFALGQLSKKQRGEKDVIENYQYKGVTKSGGIIWIDVYSKTIKYEGNPADFITIIDVTEKKESEEKFRTIAEQSFLGIGIIQGGKIKYLNKTILRITGYNQQEVSNWSTKEFFKLVHPEDLAIAIKKFQRMETGNLGTSGAYPYRIFTKSKEIKWIEINSRVIQYQGKKAILVSLIDVTPRKKAETLIIEENKRLLELDELR